MTEHPCSVARLRVACVLDHHGRGMRLGLRQRQNSRPPRLRLALVRVGWGVTWPGTGVSHGLRSVKA